MAKITVPALLKRKLVVEVDSKVNPKKCFVSEPGSARSRLYFTGGKRYKNGHPVGLIAEKQKDFMVVATGRIFSRYVLTAGNYRYKAEGILFLTSLEEVLVQCGFDLNSFNAMC